jgi:uncharacterized protein (UPF0335 family)
MAKAANKGNGYDKAALTSIVGEIEGCMADLLSERGSYMQRCRSIRERITDAYERAKEAGIPVKELRLLVRNRAREAKIEQSIAELEADAQATYELLYDALGDFKSTPLGEAALDKAKPKGETLDSLASL